MVDRGFGRRVRAPWLRRMARLVLKAGGASPRTEMSIVITGQDKMQRLNKEYLGEDAPTDVLSFPMVESVENAARFVSAPDRVTHLGEVIISYPQAEKQAPERGHDTRKEIAVLLVHGILHLLGYDHDTPDREQAMRAREADIARLLEEQPA